MGRIMKIFLSVQSLHNRSPKLGLPQPEAGSQPCVALKPSQNKPPGFDPSVEKSAHFSTLKTNVKLGVPQLVPDLTLAIVQINSQFHYI